MSTHRPLSKSAVSAALVILVLGALFVGRGQEIGKQPATHGAIQAAIPNPEGVSFTIRLKDGKAQFRQGESISVELVFSSNLPRTYRLDAATYDRSGRLHADTFHLSPHVGLYDPLRDYFQSGLSGFMLGGLRGIPELESKPYIITVELNEWFRFERPGRYKLYVSNNRVSKFHPDKPMVSGETLRVTSNTIDLEILPADPKWSNQKLLEATTTLDTSKNAAERRAACRTLRFLNSDGAAKEMVRRFTSTDSECNFEYYIGLIGAPDRLLVIREMEAAFGLPNYPVTSSFINVISFLRYILDYPEPMPPYPTGDIGREKLWQAEMQKRRDAHKEVTGNYYEQLTSAVATKQREALAVSLNTLLEHKSGARKDSGDDPLAAAITAHFSDLPPDAQNTILNYRWKKFASPALLPVLRRIYAKPPQSRSDLRDIALRRIYELAPDEGRELVLKDIQSGSPRASATVLGILPDETLPELDQTVAARLDQLDAAAQFELVGAYSPLIARYATDSILSQIKAASANKIGTMACAIQTPLLAYFLRVDRGYGIQVLDLALSARDPKTRTGCYRRQLSELTELYWHPDLEPVALALLNDPNPEMMAQGAIVLSQNGSSANEKHLWDMLEEWHERHSGHEQRLRSDLKRYNVGVDLTTIERVLMTALSSSNAWLANLDKLKKLQQLCITEQCKQEAVSLLSRADSKVITVYFNSSDNTIEHVSLAQYDLPSIPALKLKLAQFPKGTTFMWSTSEVSQEKNEELFTELQTYLKEREMKLEKFRPE